MWYGQDVMRYKLLYEMIMFCWSYRQLAEALWLSLCCIRCKRHIIALLYRYAIAIVARAIVGETTMWRHIDIDQDDGDHGVMPVTMVIMTVLRRWRSQAQDNDGHIISQHALQKQVRRPLLCCCKFYVAAMGWARTVLTYTSKPQW